jgi:choline dehydrogenase-like flavoprotein
MTANRQGSDRSPVADADVCIVGSGPAGAILADALAGRGRRVVVLEAGERYTPADRFARMEQWLRADMDRYEFWLDEERDRYTSSGEVFARLNENRAKGVGGSSLLWNGNTPRLHPKDFEMGTRYDNAPDWPISYDDIEPYYAAAEREMGVSGSVDNPHGPPRSGPFPMPAFPPSYSDELFAQACDALGIELASQPKAIASEPYEGRPECDGYGVCNTCPIGAKYSAEEHVARAEKAGAVVIDRAQVLRLEHDERGDRVTAAVYATPDGTYRQEARQFVLAAGGVETPRLLLLSASDAHPDGLANSSGAVGRYLFDHPEVEVYARLDGVNTWQNNIGFVTSRSDQFYEPDEATPGTFTLVFHNRAGPGLSGLMGTDLAINQVFGALGDPGLDSATALLSNPFNADQLGDGLVEGLDPDGTTTLSIRSVIEALPRAENRVTLAESRTDNHGRPVPDVSLTYGDHEAQTLARAEEVIREIFAEMGAEVTAVREVSDPTMGSHHMGTTRMGVDPATSVVDPECRTHDLSNLWIASSSVFPTGGAMNPTLTIVALALRSATAIDAAL